MIPCRNANCIEWTEPTQDYCEKCRPTPKVRKPTRGYDALEVAGIGVVTTRRILVTRPRSIRRNYGTRHDHGFSVSDARDDAELDRRKRTVPESKPGKSVAEARAERRADTLRLLKLANTHDHDYNAQ